jgi:excisionase family DNA binding protein
VGEDRTEGAQQDEPPKEYVTVGEAAKLLGIHRNTVHHRIKTGRITAHKVVEGVREVYRIERNSLDVGRTSAHVHTLDAQRPTASEELSRMIATRLDEMITTRLDEIVRIIAHNLGDVREEIGTERARRIAAETTLRDGMAEERRRREVAERERDDLRRELYALREPRQSPQRVEEEREMAESPRSAVESQEPVRRAWWRRIFGG